MVVVRDLSAQHGASNAGGLRGQLCAMFPSLLPAIFKLLLSYFLSLLPMPALNCDRCLGPDLLAACGICGMPRAWLRGALNATTAVDLDGRCASSLSD
jgi:hypothetical protein